MNPKLIVTLGRFSLGCFPPGESISRARGKVQEKDGRLIYPVMYPVVGVRLQELRTSIIQDFQVIPSVLQDAIHSMPALSVQERQEAPIPEQLSLF